MTKLTLDIPEDRMKKLEGLMYLSGIETKAELLNNAVTLFEWMVRQAIKGNKIASIDTAHQEFRVVTTPVLDALLEKSFSEQKT